MAWNYKNQHQFALKVDTTEFLKMFESHEFIALLLNYLLQCVHKTSQLLDTSVMLLPLLFCFSGSRAKRHWC